MISPDSNSTGSTATPDPLAGLGLNWSPTTQVATTQGARNLRKAPTNDAFRAKWRHEKEALKAAGFSCQPDKKTGAWFVLHWSDIKTEEFTKNIEASVATDAI